MTNMLHSLKVVAAVRPQHVSPNVKRRNNLAARIDQQILVAQSLNRGEQYIATVTQRKRDPVTGVVTESLRQRRVKECWWVSNEGKLLLQLRYALRTIEFVKGKSAIEIESMEKLIPTLELLKQATITGELDEQLTATAGKIVRRSKVKRS